MEKIRYFDVDIRVAMEDINRQESKIANECLHVWDSMRGKLPSFQCFCQSYMCEKFNEWVAKARWN